MSVTAPEMTAGQKSLPRSALFAIAALVAVVGVYWETAWSMVSIWHRSETFAHGFLIAPISAYLIWRKRDLLRRTAAQPNAWGLVALAGLGLLWTLARFGSVLVVEQLALIAMIPATLWTLLGRRVVTAIAFPLGFLVFSVPMGEALIPSLMNITADFVVVALQLTGIPVYREGTFFSIPSGDWSVVEGCSGVRYLIASITLGCLYAYLNYRSFKRRLLFTVLSAVVPIIANGLRAYMIVMIAHLSDMKLALGVDHLIYGWVFFGVVMLLLFWIGSFWREDDRVSEDFHQDGRPPASQNFKPYVALGGILAVTALWPALAAIRMQPTADRVVGITLPAVTGEWQLSPKPLSEWRPRYLGADAELDQAYSAHGKTVGLYVRYYREPRQDAELVNSQNVMVLQKDPVWHHVDNGVADVRVNAQEVRARAGLVEGQGQRLLVWHWYWLDGYQTSDPYVAKIWEAKARLLGEDLDSAGIILAAEFEGNRESAAATLQQFLDAMLPSIEHGLKDAAAE